MANPTITNTNVRNVRLGENEYIEKTVATNQVLTEGAVLGEIAVAAGVASAPTGTGDGVLSAFALSATGAPATIGTYTLTCIVAAANNGTFELVGPGGDLLDSIVLAGGTATFTGAGMTFVITDGAADFIVGDFFTLTIIAGSGQLLLAVSTATDGSGKARYVLGSDLDTSATGLNAATLTRVIKSGSVRESMLSFGGADTLATVIEGQPQKENLRDYTILTEPSIVIDSLENQ